MFLVSDSQSTRHARIKTFIGADSSIGALLATVDFEWTIRRTIIGCGLSPNSRIRTEVLSRCHGLDKYKEAWREEVGARFPEFRSLPSLLSDWKFLKEQAFPLRHRLVHGVEGSVGAGFARERTLALLKASSELCQFANGQGVKLYARLPVRRASRSRDEGSTGL
jgi:hypothetical protein